MFSQSVVIVCFLFLSFKRSFPLKYPGDLCVMTMMMMLMNFHVSMYLADANWGHNIKIKKNNE